MAKDGVVGSGNQRLDPELGSSVERCSKSHPQVLSLFTGAGGLDIGLEAAGFETRLCVEIDEEARATLVRNRPDWKLATPGDIHAISPKKLLKQAKIQTGDIDLIAGGPPCQPFSKSSYWSRGDSLRLSDPRAATLTAYLGVVRAALPRVLLLENVRGLTYAGKDEGLRLLEAGLEEINKREGTSYRLSILHLNAADYGVPQFRERVFLIASRTGTLFSAPQSTHGDQEGVEPYLTAWDAIGDLDITDWPRDLAPSGKWARLLPSIPEGENYLWHTPGSGGEPLFGWRTRYWSFLLKLSKCQPSWTIQAAPGPATGPFHWRSRLLSVRELCRLQTLPDDYFIEGDRRSAQRQIGNAVPCALAEILGREIRRQLFADSNQRIFASLIPVPRVPCPPRERVSKVPPEYLSLRGDYKPHPGTGLGPGAQKRRSLSPAA